MELKHLKWCAERLRDTITIFSQIEISHSQALDLVAALPGLRNWPEVRAFPDRITSFTADAAAAKRLAKRAKDMYGVTLTPSELLQDLDLLEGPALAAVSAIISHARSDIWRVLERRATGLMLFGSTRSTSLPAIDMAAAALSMVIQPGAAVFVRPTIDEREIDPAQLPPIMRALPRAKSIAEAYKKGFRQMIIDPTRSTPAQIWDYSQKALLLAHTAGPTVTDAFATVFHPALAEDAVKLEAFIGVLAELHDSRPGRDGWFGTDLFLTDHPFAPTSLLELELRLHTDRKLCWEEGFLQMATLGVYSEDEVVQAVGQHACVKALLTLRRHRQVAA